MQGAKKGEKFNKVWKGKDLTKIRKKKEGK